MKIVKLIFHNKNIEDELYQYSDIFYYGLQNKEYIYFINNYNKIDIINNKQLKELQKNNEIEIFDIEIDNILNYRRIKKYIILEDMIVDNKLFKRGQIIYSIDNKLLDSLSIFDFDKNIFNKKCKCLLSLNIHNT